VAADYSHRRSARLLFPPLTNIAHETRIISDDQDGTVAMKLAGWHRLTPLTGSLTNLDSNLRSRLQIPVYRRLER